MRNSIDSNVKSGPVGVGVLTHLTLSNCGLGSMFAMGAAFQLYFDTSLRELNVEHHYFAIGPLRSLIGALEFNKTLLSLVVYMGAQHPHRELYSLFNMIREVGAFSRLKLHWVCPRASDFSYSTLAAFTPSAYVKMDGCREEEAAEYLDTIASNRNIDLAVIEFPKPAEPGVVQRLVDTLSSTKNLVLHVTLPDAIVVKLFRALECNRTIYMLALHRITFSKRNAQALARLIVNSRTLTFLSVDLRPNDIDVDRTVESRRLCHELKEAFRRNIFITDLCIDLGSCDLSSDQVIRDAVRRNSMLASQAVRFVEGSMEKADALAFETLQHCESVRVYLHVHSNVSPESAVQMVVAASKRLTFNYFIITGVVQSKISCHRNRKAKKKTLFDNIARGMQARICSYLSLRDVVEI
ncbi:hypothetical protein HPB50_027858 [Hyalomma asiaticum]|nr:hypothetical protein HPB50_027858 [Hyalomma asiaticum]